MSAPPTDDELREWTAMCRAFPALPSNHAIRLVHEVQRLSTALNEQTSVAQAMTRAADYATRERDTLANYCGKDVTKASWALLVRLDQLDEREAALKKREADQAQRYSELPAAVQSFRRVPPKTLDRFLHDLPHRKGELTAATCERIAGVLRWVATAALDVAGPRATAAIAVADVCAELVREGVLECPLCDGFNTDQPGSPHHRPHRSDCPVAAYEPTLPPVGEALGKSTERGRSVNAEVACDDCSGTGTSIVVGRGPLSCRTCGGSGRVPQGRTGAEPSVANARGGE